MSTKKMETCKIVSQEKIGNGIYSMWLQTEEIAGLASAGQFVSVYSRDGSRLLPRPISICEIDKERGCLRLVYRVAGKGTLEFSRLHAGISLKVMGPVETAKQLEAEKILVMGYKDELFLEEDLRGQGKLYVATEDGSAGTRGNVLDAIREHELKAEIIFACGPSPMLKALKEYAAQEKIVCWISMEERMACGIGACLGCVCQSKDIDSHSHVHNKRVCKDGPVFLSTEVEL